MNDPRLPEKKFQPFILTKDRTVSLRLSNHVYFVRAAPNLYEEFSSNKDVLGHNGHLCLLWIISNCANKLWAMSHKKSFRYPKRRKERLMWCKILNG